MGVQSALYRCHTKGCYASISLKTHKVGEVNEVFDPMVVTNFNFKHKVGCEPKTDAQFDVRSFIYKVKEKVKEDPIPIPMPDYSYVRDRFKRIRSKNRKLARNLKEVIVSEPYQNTLYGKRFLIHDNLKKNKDTN
jgi:hypothetical protein